VEAEGVEAEGVEAEDDEEFDGSLESREDGSPTSPESGDSIVTSWRQEALNVIKLGSDGVDRKH
jgi:hypothetical protein